MKISPCSIDLCQQRVFDLWIRNLLGNDFTSLIFASGKVISKDILKSAGIVGLYFSSSSSSKKLTSLLFRLSKKYLSLKIICISCDKCEKDMEIHCKTLPFLFLPFNPTKTRSLMNKFCILSIPSLVLLDSARLEIITTYGVTKLLADPKGCNFPWRINKTEMFKLLFSRLTEDFGCGIGIYFTRSDSGPCKRFAPLLDQFCKFFESFKLITIYVSLHLTPINDDDADLMQFFKIRQIPSLVLLDKEGTLITVNGVQSLKNFHSEFSWKPRKFGMEELNPFNWSILQENIVVLGFPNSIKNVVERKTFCKFLSSEASAKSSETFRFFIVVDNELEKALKELLEIHSDNSQLFVVNFKNLSYDQISY